MVKHGIMLAICFMFYLMGNIIATTAGLRFESVKLCYQQMFANKIIHGINGIQQDPEENFDIVMERFYRSFSNAVEMRDVIVDFTLRLFRETDATLNSFLNDFAPQNDFRGKIFDLRGNRHLPDPLMFFVANYSHDAPLRFYTMPALFCEAYMNGASFDGA